MSNGVLFWQTTFGFCRPVGYFVEGMELLVERLWDSTEIYTTLFLSTFSVTNLRAFWQFSTNSLLIRHPPTNSVFVSPTYVGFCQILSNIQLSKYVQRRLMSNLRAFWHSRATRSIKCRLIGKLIKFFSVLLFICCLVVAIHLL